MGRYHKIVCLLLIIVLLLSLVGCGKKDNQYLKTPSSYWENGLQVSCTPIVKSGTLSDVDVQLSGMKDKDSMSRITARINEAIEFFSGREPQKNWGSEKAVSGSVPNVAITAHVVSNFSNCLSMILKKQLTYENNVTLYETRGINFDLETGKEMKLSDLFDMGEAVYSLVSRHLLSRLSSYTVVAPFEGIDDTVSFTFDAKGISLYFTPEMGFFYHDLQEEDEIRIQYTAELFSHLTIFDREPSLNMYESLPNKRHLIAYPSAVSVNKKETVNGMEIQYLAITPIQYPSADCEKRIEHLKPLIEDIVGQATGSQGEKAFCYFYAERVGRFMVVRVTQEEYAGMNRSSSDRIYVLDAVTGDNLPIDSLFVHGYDYAADITEKLYPNVSQSDLDKEKRAVLQAQIIPRQDGFLIRYTTAAIATSSLYSGKDPYISYADLGLENLLIYE